ncbi:MAG: class I SAM-dependent methyltransferase [Geopsychrobacter sp.]|nr:class I SAM-dependent methyltransferase [Geopsychrobacter sp.]
MKLLAAEIAKHLPQQGEARRLFHGRGRTFIGYQDLLIDSYGSTIFVTLFAERSANWLAALCDLLRALSPEVKCIAVQRRDQLQMPLQILFGALPDKLIAREAGLNYLLRLEGGQNIGFFIDMAVGRALVRQVARHKKVLNLFAYSCSFSVAALAGGARQVVNVDMNRGALALGRQNHQLNQLDLRLASFLPHEIFRSFNRLSKLGPFDLIICDPPYSQGQNFTAEKHWPKLLSKLPQLLAEEGEVIACLNAPHLNSNYLPTLFADFLPHLSEKQSLAAGPDFPEAQPERGLSIHHFVRK